MCPPDQEAVADFIRTNGVTRCPTACGAPTQATIAAQDQQLLRQRFEEREIAWQVARQEQLRRAWVRRVGAKTS